MTAAFLQSLGHYLAEIVPSLALGFLISGLIHEFVPQSVIDRHLVQKGIRPILYTTLAGIILPLCCMGTLPVAVGLRRRGVGLGPVLSFLVATPATSVSAILVTYSLMGLKFTLFLCFSIIFMGVAIGLIGNLFSWDKPESISSVCAMCEDCFSPGHRHHSRTWQGKAVSVLSYGFIDLPREMGKELIAGLLLAAFVDAFTPIGRLVRAHLSGSAGYLFALIFGLLMYICATASVPFVHAFVSHGLSQGAGVVLLLVGPITSYGTMLVLRKEFGNKILIFYLSSVGLLALFSGWIYSFL
ncbi:MAG TPA: permease [bacterium]|nr:permease [bacterium]